MSYFASGHKSSLHVGLTPAALAASAADDEHTATALTNRVEFVLQRLPQVSSGPRHAVALLGTIAQDVGVQRLLRGRLLARMLVGDPRFELGEDPKRGVTVRLVKSARPSTMRGEQLCGNTSDALLRPLLLYQRIHCSNARSTPPRDYIIVTGALGLRDSLH